MTQRISRSGFYGKLASHGDFISRRLAPAFLRTWDQWLQEGLTSSRERLGEQWQAAYLCSPIWRFALASGVCGEPAWAGVLMPSVDRVGRYFPLTLAYGGPPVSTLQRLNQDGDWYAELEALALSSLEPGFCLNSFDNALLSLRAPSRAGSPMWGHGRAAGPGESWRELPPGQDWSGWLASLELSDDSARALFWTDGSPHIAASLLLCSDLPSARTFADMLSGRPPTH
ncbi:type VI secretion system-associated protein TagF [Pseudomonas sp. SZMC_28357]|uniref:type VI secretion system-associated protein TagF n=1 Tax=Pseudomonas sp. SZMC_28357 TaxID=3074380 RepID=UPI0028711FBC|nr:type VI secretion system-associated protein TagF [Pseudomonas sp. SZMC_28357]MDR9751374.1 type VI secretion system-associated protein TagF [Pseudomonas sp. SZMC_28357]